MDFFKKNGKYIELGGFGLAFLSLFFPFLTITIKSIVTVTANFNMLAKPTVGLGILSLLFILVGLAVTALATFKPELLVKLGNAEEPVVNYGPLGAAGLTLLFVIVAGLSNIGSEYHLGAGFYFLFLALGAVIASCVIRRFVLKEMYTSSGKVTPKVPVTPQPVMNQGPIQSVQLPRPVEQPKEEPPVNPNQNQQ